MAAEAGTTSAPDEGRSPAAAAASSERLYARHNRMVFGLCRALLRDPTEAEDAAQQVFLSAHRSLLNGAEPHEPAAWLATIARNECWARISGRMREPLPSDAADEVAGHEDPVAEAIRRADLAALWRAIRALPRQQREALLLREFGGLRYDELAAALAVTEPAVESLLFRARTRLRAQLQSAAAALAPLARLIASGGGPAVAAKAAALGLGAAAVTGTVVVAPDMLDHRPHRSSAPAAHPVRTVRTVRESLPIAYLQAPPTAAPRPVLDRTAGAGTRTEGERHDGGSTAAEAERHDGGTTTTEAERHDGGTTTTETQPHDGGTSTAETEQHDGGDAATTSSSGGRDGGSEGGSGDGGRTPAAPTLTAPTAPVVSVTVPTVDQSGGDVGAGD